MRKLTVHRDEYTQDEGEAAISPEVLAEARRQLASAGGRALSAQSTREERSARARVAALARAAGRTVAGRREQARLAALARWSRKAEVDASEPQKTEASDISRLGAKRPKAPRKSDGGKK